MSNCLTLLSSLEFFFFFQAEDGIRDLYVTGVQTCALPISFTDPWALALYAYVAGTALAARRWNAGVKDPSTARWTARGGELLWVLCGAAVFAGGSVELQRYF